MYHANNNRAMYDCPRFTVMIAFKRDKEIVIIYDAKHFEFNEIAFIVLAGCKNVGAWTSLCFITPLVSAAVAS